MVLPFRGAIGDWVSGPRVQNVIIGLIVFNAITLGLETSQTVRSYAGEALGYIEAAVLAIFIAEIGLKLYAFGPRFFREGWNVFDFTIVGISLVPASGPFAVFRTLRILRTLRLLTKIPRLRHIIESLLAAIPSIGWIVFVMVFYIFGVMGTKLFGEAFPEDFGHLGRTVYTLFQVMTLESWSESIARPVMQVYPYAWLYFIPFILITALTILNLFIGIIVNTMQERQLEEQAGEREASESQARNEREAILQQLAQIDERLSRLEDHER
jgi:voltage-gated sodium channel